MKVEKWPKTLWQVPCKKYSQAETYKLKNFEKQFVIITVMQNQPTPPESENPEQASVSTDAAPPAKDNSNTMGMLCHLLALCGLLGVPFGNILGPLVMWLVKKEEMPFVDECGKEALNFQISMTIYTIIAGLSVLIFIGFLLLPGIIVLNLVLTIIASLKASEGTCYEYPLTFRFIK
ncbi:MAG: DUF4870 domain-containing protein [Opitutales bacterium]